MSLPPIFVQLSPLRKVVGRGCCFGKLRPFTDDLILAMMRSYRFPSKAIRPFPDTRWNVRQSACIAGRRTFVVCTCVPHLLFWYRNLSQIPKQRDEDPEKRANVELFNSHVMGASVVASGTTSWKRDTRVNERKTSLNHNNRHHFQTQSGSPECLSS